MKEFAKRLAFPLLAIFVSSGMWTIFKGYAEHQQAKEIALLYNNQLIANKGSSIGVKHLVSTQEVKSCMQAVKTTTLNDDLIYCLQTGKI